MSVSLLLNRIESQFILEEYSSMKRAMLIAAAFWTVSAGTAWPIDQIYTSTSEKRLLRQDHQHDGDGDQFRAAAKDAPSEIPANEITRIIFENSPDGLLAAQKDMLDGEYEKAIDALKKEIAGGQAARRWPRRSSFAARIARPSWRFPERADPIEAGKQMYAFITNSPNSFHYLKACELMGDICVTLGKFADAQKYYAKLSQAPWPDYKIRAQVALGRSYLAQDNAAAADKAFDDALNNDAPGELAEAQRTAARIGKARCMVLTGKTDLALRSLNEILDRTDEKHPEINAMAYNALGTALRKAGKPKEAILAFLHVHLVYYHAARPRCRGGRQPREAVHRGP